MGGAQIDNDLPTGVVTFLLTDVVGSTRLWERDPTAMGTALVLHDRLVAEAITANDGLLLKARGEGDSTFSVFRRPSDAAAAAVTAQRAIVAETWPTDANVVVRMAIHTGEAIERGGDYYGPTINRVARLRAVAGPGEVLLSQGTASLLRDGLAPDTRLVDLGNLELRDLARPERVYALVAPGLLEPAAFGPKHTSVPDRIPLPSRIAALPETGFAGREEESERLRIRAKEVEAGDLRVVLIGGEPGMGKTRLAAEACRELWSSGWTVLYGRCDEETGLAYQPFNEALRQYVEALGDEFAVRHGRRSASELARFIPDLSAAVGEWDAPTPASDPEAERYRLLGWFVSVASEASDRAPVALVLDDLHWADKPTLHLLRHLVTTGQRMRVLVIGTYRDSDLSGSQPLVEALAALRRAPSVERVALRGLDDIETLDLMEAQAGRMLGDKATGLARLLRQETGGNPFFASEILRHLVETGNLTQGADGEWEASTDLVQIGLPDSVREVVGQRVRHVGDDALRLLSLAAVIGRDFDVSVLAKIADTDEDTVIDVMDRAVAASLLIEIPGDDDRYGFAHAIVQQTLYGELGAARRRRAHQKVATILEEMPGVVTDRPAELAHHWGRATEPTDAAKAAMYAQLAAERALAQLAPDEAIRWYHHGLELLRPGDQDRRLDLLIGLGDAQRQAGEPDHRDTLLAASSLAQQLGDADALVRAAVANNRGCNSASGQVDRDRVGALEAALGAVGPDDRTERALVLATLATELSWDPDLAPRQQLAREAIDVARRLDEPGTLVRCLNMCHNPLWLPANLDERDLLTAEAMELAEQVGDPVAQFWAAAYRQTWCVEVADLDGVDRCHERMVEITDAIGQPTLRWVTGVERTWRALMAGAVDEAEDLAEVNFKLGSECGQPDTFIAYSSLILGLRRAQGRVAELLPIATTLAADNPGLPIYQATLARIHADLGQMSDAAAIIRRGTGLGFPLPVDMAFLPGLVTWADAIATVGDAAAAAIVYEKLAPWSHIVAFHGASVHGSVAHYLGILAGAMGRDDAARAHLAAAASVHAALKAPWFIGETSLAQARLGFASSIAPEVARFPMLAARADQMDRA